MISSRVLSYPNITRPAVIPRRSRTRDEVHVHARVPWLDFRSPVLLVDPSPILEASHPITINNLCHRNTTPCMHASWNNWGVSPSYLYAPSVHWPPNYRWLGLSIVEN
jgi:hypothetical protein